MRSTISPCCIYKFRDGRIHSLASYNYKYSLTLVKREFSSTAMKALVITLLVQAAIAAPSSEVTTEHGTLTLEGIVKRGADAHVRGSFRSAEGDGIRFVSTPDYLKIMTTDGENIVEASSARIQTYEGDRYAAYFQLLDKSYADIDDRTYSLPESAAATVQSVTDPIQRTDLFARLQTDPSLSHRVRAAVQESVERLASHPAIRLLEPAAQALGEDLGVTGMEHPAALRFYLTAMKLTEARAMSQEAEASNIEPWRRYFEGKATIESYPNCNLRTCPPCREDECLGLCGRICTCWSWVCGDCCLHNGCLEHDLCCRESFFSSRCLLPVGISCSRYTC